MYYGVVPCGLWLLVVVGWRIYAILSAHFLRPDSLSDRFMHNKCEQTFFIKLVYLYHRWKVLKKRQGSGQNSWENDAKCLETSQIIFFLGDLPKCFFLMNKT